MLCALESATVGKEDANSSLGPEGEIQTVTTAVTISK